jgi:ribonuclease HI
MVHQFGAIVVYNVYVIPESTNWAGDLERDPCLALAASLALARAGHFEMVLLGDFNGRTGSHTPTIHDPFHVSNDIDFVSTRGKFLFRLLIAKLETGKDESKKALNLFGPVSSVTGPSTVTICGFCKGSGKHTAEAGAAVFFGENSQMNRAIRVWGTQNNARADLVALLLAVRIAPKTRNLVITTRSEYAIRSIKYYAYRNEACGWKCVNGDVLKLIIAWIRCRTAPIHFSHIKKDKPTDAYK